MVEQNVVRLSDTRCDSSLVCRSVADAADRPYSYVVVTTKAVPELVRTPSLLSSLLSSPYADQHPQPTYVLMQNGLNVEVDLYEALKKLKPSEEPRIISTAVWIGTELKGNNVGHNGFVRVPQLSCLFHTLNGCVRIASRLASTDHLQRQQ